MADQPELTVADADAWRSWLGANHADPTGVRLVLAKKGAAGPAGPTYDRALEEALWHGWIDGQSRRRDESTWRQRFTPRRVRSPWWARNTDIVARLVEEGRMCPPGLAEVERAEAVGRWDAAYAGPAATDVPVDLADALAANPPANAMFEILTSANRYAILHRPRAVKRTETRARRLDEFVTTLARGETVYPRKRTLGADPGADG